MDGKLAIFLCSEFSLKHPLRFYKAAHSESHLSFRQPKARATYRVNLISGSWKHHQTRLILDISSLASCWLHLIMGVDDGVKGLQNQLCFLLV